MCGLAPRAMRLLNRQAVQNKPPRGQRLLTPFGDQALRGSLGKHRNHGGSREAFHESINPWLSMHLHAALVLHKESVHRAQSRGSVNFLRSEKFSGSDSRHYLESAPALNLQGFFFFLPLFLETKKKRDRINFSLIFFLKPRKKLQK